MGNHLIGFSRSRSEIENQIVELVRLGKTEYLDYKSRWHECNAELVNDILFLSNARAEYARYIISGIADLYTLKISYGCRNIAPDMLEVTEEDFKIRQNDVIQILDGCGLKYALSNYVH